MPLYHLLGAFIKKYYRDRTETHTCRLTNVEFITFISCKSYFLCFNLSRPAVDSEVVQDRHVDGGGCCATERRASLTKEKKRITDQVLRAVQGQRVYVENSLLGGLVCTERRKRIQQALDVPFIVKI